MRGRTPIDRDALVLSVLIPVYNERNTIELILNQVHAVPVRKEIICVNDFSTDGTNEILDRLYAEGRIHQLIHQPHNMGKGAAIRTALAASTGNVVIVQDADLEYDPADWPALLEPIISGPRRCRVRVALSQRAASRAVLLAFGREQAAHAW